MLDDPRSRKILPRLMAISQVGLMMAAPALFGLFVDGWLGISPWCVIVGAVLGLIGGMIHLVRVVQPEGPGNAGGPDEGRKP